MGKSMTADRLKELIDDFGGHLEVYRDDTSLGYLKVGVIDTATVDGEIVLVIFAEDIEVN
jgi:hypothetical protein